MSTTDKLRNYQRQVRLQVVDATSMLSAAKCTRLAKPALSNVAFEKEFGSFVFATRAMSSDDRTFAFNTTLPLGIRNK